jgi:predicted amidophosphoribosyltransferase
VQHTLTYKQRQKNLRHAFSCPKIDESINTIAILDDIMTTGATVNALCDAIKHHRPEIQIHIWCLARAHLTN